MAGCCGGSKSFRPASSTASCCNTSWRVRAQHEDAVSLVAGTVVGGGDFPGVGYVTTAQDRPGVSTQGQGDPLGAVWGAELVDRAGVAARPQPNVAGRVVVGYSHLVGLRRERRVSPAIRS